MEILLQHSKEEIGLLTTYQYRGLVSIPCQKAKPKSLVFIVSLLHIVQTLGLKEPGVSLE